MTLARSMLLVLIASATAFAQSPAAESLFRDGRTLLAQGKLQEACDKFAASETIEPSVGTLLNLGDCRERLGRLATAWAAFRKAEALARASGKDDRREAEARRRAGLLEPRLPTLTIQSAHQPAPIVIERNGEKIEPGVLGTAVPVDPGSYRITAEAPGYKPYWIAISLHAESKREITIPPLEPDEPVVVPPPARTVDIAPNTAPPPRTAPPRSIVTTDVPEPSMWTTSRQVSVAAIAAGALAIGGGAYFGLHSQDLENRSDKLCPTATCADPQGLQLNQDAKTNATRANILYALGGAALTTGLVLWFVGGPDEHPVLSPDVSFTSVGATVSGVF